MPHPAAQASLERIVALTDRESSLMPKTYVCKNPACSLGTPGHPGVFSEGATKEFVTLLTGDPDPKDYGKGVCPNCGKPGKENE
jgi:hypothetical protein